MEVLKDFLIKLKKNNNKILIIPDNIANEVEELSKAMNTTSIDTIKTAIDLLTYSLGREVSIKQSESNLEMNIPIFKRFKPIKKIDK